MKRNELLNELDKLGVKLSVKNEQLIINAPKGVLTPELRQSLKEYKQEIITLLRETQRDTPSVEAIAPDSTNKYEPFPLTDIQKAYWIGRSGIFELGNVAINGYVEFETNNIDVSRLTAVWQKLIDRHDMLRAIVLPTGEQKILEQVPSYEIAQLDLRGLETKEINTKLTAIRRELSHQILPSDRWPLFDIRATYLDNEIVRLHINLDLLMMDAASIQILFQEWNQLYNNPEVKLPPLTLSFRDYVINKNALKSPESIEQSRNYWFNRLDSLPPAPELPLAFFPGQLKNYRFKRYRGQLQPEIWHQLKQKGEKAGVTPSIILLTAFAEVLTFWSKNPYFTLNLTVFERLSIHPEVNQIVGDFTNTILLLIDNSTINTITNRAEKIKKQLLQDLDYIQISGIEVLQELTRRSNAGLTALMPIVFTSILGLNSSDEKDLKLNFLGEEVYSVSQTPQVWLDHQVTEQNGGLLFNWDVVEELFPEGLIEDMFTAYCDLLDRLANSDLAWVETNRKLLPPAQLQQRIEINNTSTIVPQQTLHGLFIEQAKVQPESLAVITPNYKLTYQELDRRATQLGDTLSKLGATANKLIAVVMEKGWEQIVAVLGILMSGAAYLPIDPNQPQERQWYLLKQAEVNLVVTQPHLETKLSFPEGVKLLTIDENLEELQEGDVGDRSTNQDLAYVIYTSGSTGKPKGVAINHRGAVNTILDINQRFAVSESDRVLALSALNFDLSVYDIFGILAAGGTIVIPRPESVKDPAHWLDLIVSTKVTLWNSVPALMQMLVEYLSTQATTTLPSLRLALLSGDWLPLNLPQQIQSLSTSPSPHPSHTPHTSPSSHTPHPSDTSQVQVVSLGGATEASIWSIYYPIEKIDSDWKSIPYGKPLSNQQFYVFNQLMEATPVWVTGELYIGGEGLALGYWQDTQKTEASFITHPVTKERLYKTGDLGRYLPDGNIEFLGREDFQVKINGHRIELGEIEAALKQHPSIKEAVVNAIGEERGNKSLIGYFVPETDKVSELTQPEITNTQLRSFLKEKLPDYTIPSTFVELEFLPLTPNGKINRQALPIPSQILPESEKTFVAPRNSVEELLAETWIEVFKFEQVSIHDNFFELGGYSFLALQLTAKINQKLNANISLSLLFQYPTIAKLAELIAQNPDVVAKPTYLVPISIEGTQPPLFCIHPSGGQVMVYNNLANCLGTDIPVYGIQSRALNDPNQEHQSIEDMAIEYTNIIRQYQPNEPYYLIGWSMGGVLAVNIAQQLEQQQQKLAFVGLVDALLSATAEPDPLTDLVSVFGGTLVNALTTLEQIELQQLREELKILTPLERLERMLTWGQKRNVLSGDIPLDILEKQLILTEMHDKLLSAHRIPQIQSRLDVWMATDRLGVETSHTDWSKYTTGECDIRNLDGSHFTIIRPPYINIIAQELKKCLAAVSS